MALERARYEATRAERRYRAVDAENRLVARGLEREWEGTAAGGGRLAEAELTAREHRLLAGPDCGGASADRPPAATIWSRCGPHQQPRATRDRKELLRTLLMEVIIKVDRPSAQGGELTTALARWSFDGAWRFRCPAPPIAPLRTDEKTLTLLRRLAVHYPDGMIASILNRQGAARSARGARFTAEPRE